MEHSFWLNKWQENQLGFHQAEGHPLLVQYFPALPKGSSVLVPLAGKTLDMIWLAKQGYQVVGVELSDLAAKSFFEENLLSVDVEGVSINEEMFKVYRCSELPITLYIGDFFKFEHVQFKNKKFDALYDRAALIALPEDMRSDYVHKCKGLLTSQTSGLIITTVYDQSIAAGPPFSVSDEELRALWERDMEKVAEEELIDQEPRWQSKGLTSFKEHVWRWSD